MKESGFVKSVKIHTEFITLGQLIKHIDLASSGGMVKQVLEDYKISVNDLLEKRRGKKLYPGDKVSIKSVGQFRITNQ